MYSASAGVARGITPVLRDEKCILAGPIHSRVNILLTWITKTSAKERGKDKYKQKSRDDWNGDVDFFSQEWTTEKGVN